MEGVTFELLENAGGHAKSATRMTFTNASQPFRATYEGPNVTFGHAIVENNVMLYHARNLDGTLAAGQAEVELTDTQMILRWRWLTGEATSGVSVWQRLVD